MTTNASHLTTQLAALPENREATLDYCVKCLLADKQILARILKYTLTEFEHMEIDDIIPCIEGTPLIGDPPVEPGLTNAGRIQGSQTEQIILNEGMVRFDIYFPAVYGKEHYKIYIDVEAQKTSDSKKIGYQIEKRMIYYLSRMISSQKETEFTGSDYGKIKPVKSIWICMDSDTDSIDRFTFLPTRVFGKSKQRSILRTMEGVIVNIRATKEEIEASKNTLISMLEDLLRRDTVENKKQKLVKHGIQMTTTVEGGINDMCNYSSMIREGGFSVGHREGRNEGITIGRNEGISIGRNEGLSIGRRDGLIAQVRLVKRIGMSPQKAFSLITQSKDYQDVTLAQIEKLYKEQ